MLFSFLVKKIIPALFLVFTLNFGYASESTAIPLSMETNAAAVSGSVIDQKLLFPQALFTEFLTSRDLAEAGQPYWAATEGELGARTFMSPWESILLNSDIVAFYGHPRSRNMGILGRYSKEELNGKLDSLAAEYQAAGGRSVVKAFYIIFGTVWPDGNIGILSESILKEYIEFALENNILVFIDHQIGRFTPAEGLTRMLPWLKYPNVHLALDPEWRTNKPNEEIGSVSAEEINQVQRIMENYMMENRIPGERLLVIHQFNYVMIRNREKVQADFSRVRLVHCADGFGPPAVKRSSYAFNARATNIPVKGFKLFYNFGIPGAGYDSPIMSPKEVFELNPRPYIVMYQ